MNKNIFSKVWQLSLSTMTIMLLTSCSFSLPGQTTASQVPQEQTTGGQTLPSEADLYATAIASLGGQLTETAVVQFPTAQFGGQGTLPWVTPMPGEGEATQEGGGGEENTNTPEGQKGTPQPNAKGTSTPSTNKTKTPTPKSMASPWTTFTPVGGAYVGGGGPTTYIVQRGDWLYKIAQKFGVSANAIVAANPILAYNPSHIVTGQALIIPAPGAYGYGSYYYPIATSVWLPEYYWSYGTPLPYSTSAWLPEQYWGYGPEVWGGLSTTYARCSTGSAQSPINIDTARTQARSTQLEFNYSPQNITLVSNDYTFQADFSTGNYVKVDGVVYQLIDITFHMPGEHTINNHVFDMEMQLVHLNSQGQIAIVSILINEGNNNSNLEPIWSEIPAPPYNWTEVNNFDASGLLPSDLRAYRYTGSITSPPCAENVSWIIMASPLEISRDQLDTFSSMFPGNARPVQPLNNRIVYSNFSGE